MARTPETVVPLPGTSVGAIRDPDRSRDRAVRAPIAEISGVLQDVLGQRLTATIARVNDPKAVGAWARGTRTPHPESERRLRAAFQIAAVLGQHEGPGTVRAWFMGMDPELDDQAPAEVLAQNEDPRPVMRAARTFVAHG